MQIEHAIQSKLLRLGAVKAEVTRAGIATHWITEREADIAVGKLRDMGLVIVEKFRDNGLFAVFGKYPFDAMRN